MVVCQWAVGAQAERLGAQEGRVSVAAIGLDCHG